MTPADWIILGLVLLNVVSAAIQGFFAEALNMAGLVVGYIVAAWQYQRRANWLATFLKTWAAARPNLRTVSAVTGSTLAVPRTPSVPKIFLGELISLMVASIGRKH